MTTITFFSNGHATRIQNSLVDSRASWSRFTAYNLKSADYPLIFTLIRKVENALKEPKVSQSLSKNVERFLNHRKTNKTIIEFRKIVADQYAQLCEEILNDHLFELDNILSSQQFTGDEFNETALLDFIFPKDLPKEIFNVVGSDEYLANLNLTEDGLAEKRIIEATSELERVLLRQKTFIVQLIKQLYERGDLFIYLDSSNGTANNKEVLNRYLGSEIFANRDLLSEFITEFAGLLPLSKEFQPAILTEILSQYIGNEEIDLAQELAKELDSFCTPTLSECRASLSKALEEWYIETPIQAKIVVTDLALAHIAKNVFNGTPSEKLENLNENYIATAITSSQILHENDLKETLPSQIIALKNKINNDEEQKKVRQYLSKNAFYSLSTFPDPTLSISIVFKEEIPSETFTKILEKYLPRGHLDIDLQQLTLGKFDLQPQILSRITSIVINTQKQFDALAFSELKNLTAITIQNVIIPIHLFKHLSHLKEISLHQCSFSGDFTDVSSIFTSMPDLETIEFSGSSIEFDQLQSILNAIPQKNRIHVKLKNLESLTLEELKSLPKIFPNLLFSDPFFAGKRLLELYSEI